MWELSTSFFCSFSFFKSEETMMDKHMGSPLSVVCRRGGSWGWTLGGLVLYGAPLVRKSHLKGNYLQEGQ